MNIGLQLVKKTLDRRYVLVQEDYKINRGPARISESSLAPLILFAGSTQLAPVSPLFVACKHSNP